MKLKAVFRFSQLKYPLNRATLLICVQIQGQRLTLGIQQAQPKRDVLR